MKKTRFIGLFLAIILMFTSLVPATALAAQDDEYTADGEVIDATSSVGATYKFHTECIDETENIIKLWLELNPVDAQSMTAFSFSLRVVNKNGEPVSGRDVNFTFDASFDETEIKESRFNAETQILDLYVAGTKNLVKTESKEAIDAEGNKILLLSNTLELGTVKVEDLTDKDNRAFKIVLNGKVGELKTVGLDGAVIDVAKAEGADFAIPVDGTIYKAPKEYIVGTDVTGNGDVALADKDGNAILGNTVEEKTTVVVNATAAEGYQLESIKVVDKDGKTTDITKSKEFVANSDKTVKVVFTKILAKYTVSTEVSGNGQAKLVAVVGGKEVDIKDNIVEEKTTVRVNVLAADGYKLGSIQVVGKDGKGKDITSSKQFVADGDKTVKVVFVEDDNGGNDDNNKRCSCLCHSVGLKHVFYKIARAFWKLFRVRKYCECGNIHYL